VRCQRYSEMQTAQPGQLDYQLVLRWVCHTVNPRDHQLVLLSAGLPARPQVNRTIQLAILVSVQLDQQLVTGLIG
jgi:hypothetical protein